ncbi:PAX4 protein, partial [Rhinopomastus cyanomelas]|nr:PAX4 protein [Rhinopomastus cyanomelas]
GPSGVNQLGGLFVSGRPLPTCQRRRIVQLAASGLRGSDISRSLKVTPGCVSKILGRFWRTGALEPGGAGGAGGSRARRAPPEVVARISQLKLEQPSLFAWQIRRQLQAEGTCPGGRTPSVSSINRVLRNLPSTLWGFERHPVPGVGGTVPTGSQHPPAHQWLPVSSQYRNRTVFSRQQVEALEEEFQRGQYPDTGTRQRLAAATRLPDSTIRVWFSNRRARWRRQTRWQLEATGA